MSKSKKIVVDGNTINLYEKDINSATEDYISLTDMMRNLESEKQIENYIRNKNTLEFMASWEAVHNQDFNYPEFEVIRKEAGTNRFLMSVKQWVMKVNAIGMFSKTGRHGSGTYAHKDIAFHFGMWLSPEFALGVIKEYQILKERESNVYNLDWNYKRFLTKVNYTLQTDAIKTNIIPYSHIPQDKESIIYANEADLLNLAVFGITAKQWKEMHPDQLEYCKNIRDCSDSVQLTVLANLESYNSILIKEGKSKDERFNLLRTTAISQLERLRKLHTNSYNITSPNIKYIESNTTEKPISFGDAVTKISNAGKPKK